MKVGGCREQAAKSSWREKSNDLPAEGVTGFGLGLKWRQLLRLSNSCPLAFWPLYSLSIKLLVLGVAPGAIKHPLYRRSV